jgi:hypothetical protein
MMAFRVLGAGVIASLVAATAVAAVPQRDVNDPTGGRAVLARFDAAVGNYLRLHRFPDPIDLETLCLPEAAAHSSAALLDEPPTPREGDVFTPDVVALIRARIAALTLSTHIAHPRVHVDVGERIAAGRGARLPGVLASVLPPVPDDLGYRIAGLDIILVDLRTDLVIDALRDWRAR